MLTRVYLDNYKCFVDFEYRPGRKQLILGDNGSGKSSFLDALLLIRDFGLRGDRADDFFIPAHRTRWVSNPRQTFELEASLDAGKYIYRVVVEPCGEPPRPNSPWRNWLESEKRGTATISANATR